MARTIKQQRTEFSEVAEDDFFLMQRNSDSKTGKVKRKNAFGGAWASLGDTPDVITFLGNGCYQAVFNGVDHTDVVTAGMRARSERSVQAPTQVTSLNGSTQYWSKASPNKMTFTDDFCVYAKIKITSYANQCIVSRYNGTSGWQLTLNSSGQIVLIGYNGGAGNYSQVVSYQSVPIVVQYANIFAQLDMSSFSASSTTSYIMLDGLDVPCSVSRGGTNPTALVQAGDLQVGALNGTNFFGGKLAQVAVFNAKVTQTTARTIMSQNITGSETSLASAYSFNGAATDLNTATPNDLTATGGAAYATDSCFANGTGGYYDYFITTQCSFDGTNTTMYLQAATDNSMPTSGGVSEFSTSPQASPYGFPSGAGKFDISFIYKTSIKTQAAPTANTWYDTNLRIVKPIGDAWYLTGFASVYSDRGATGDVDHSITISTTSAAETDTNFRRNIRVNNNTTVDGTLTYNREPLIATNQTTYYLNMESRVSGVNQLIATFGKITITLHK